MKIRLSRRSSSDCQVVNSFVVFNISADENSHIVTSPLYPSPYPPVDSDVNRIQASDSSQRIRLVISELNLPEGDSLYVYDGYYCSSMSSSKVRTYRGAVNLPYPEIVFANDDQVCITLYGTHGGGSYKASWSGKYALLAF